MAAFSPHSFASLLADDEWQSHRSRARWGRAKVDDPEAAQRGHARIGSITRLSESREESDHNAYRSVNENDRNADDSDDDSDTPAISASFIEGLIAAEQRGRSPPPLSPPRGTRRRSSGEAQSTRLVTRKRVSGEARGAVFATRRRSSGAAHGAADLDSFLSGRTPLGRRVAAAAAAAAANANAAASSVAAAAAVAVADGDDDVDVDVDVDVDDESRSSSTLSRCLYCTHSQCTCRAARAYADAIPATPESAVSHDDDDNDDDDCDYDHGDDGDDGDLDGAHDSTTPTAKHRVSDQDDDDDDGNDDQSDDDDAAPESVEIVPRKRRRIIDRSRTSESPETVGTQAHHSPLISSPRSLT
jgi:hypothetical protein